MSNKTGGKPKSSSAKSGSNSPARSKSGGGKKRKSSKPAARPANLWLRVLLALVFLLVMLGGGAAAINYFFRPLPSPQKIEQKVEDVGKLVLNELSRQVDQLGGRILSAELKENAGKLVALFDDPAAKADFDRRLELQKPQPQSPPPEIKLPKTVSEYEIDAGKSAAGKDVKKIEVISRLAPSAAHPWLAVVIDDFGYSLARTKAFIDLGYPITFAVIPRLAHSRESAELASQAGFMVILHMPMQPRGWPDLKVEPGALLLGLAADEIKERFTKALAAVPHAVGTNNHMGSAFTENVEGMTTLMGEIKEKGLFFIDSRTTGKTVGRAVAKTAGVNFAERSVFLDDYSQSDAEAISGQVIAAGKAAREKTAAIAIGHPHAATEKALREIMPKLAEEGIVFVSAGDVARYLSESENLALK